jgi:hypothetical protein
MNMSDLIGVVYNTCYGGFSLSPAGEARYAELKGINSESFWAHEIPRHDPHLVQVVEELDDRAGGSYSSLQIKWMPRGSKYYISDYDGSETVLTPDTIKWEIADV